MCLKYFLSGTFTEKVCWALLYRGWIYCSHLATTRGSLELLGPTTGRLKMKPIKQKAEPRDGEKPSPDDLIWAMKPATPEAILALGFLASRIQYISFFIYTNLNWDPVSAEGALTDSFSNHSRDKQWQSDAYLILKNSNEISLWLSTPTDQTWTVDKSYWGLTNTWHFPNLTLQAVETLLAGSFLWIFHVFVWVDQISQSRWSERQGFSEAAVSWSLSPRRPWIKPGQETKQRFFFFPSPACPGKVLCHLHNET